MFYLENNLNSYKPWLDSLSGLKPSLDSRDNDSFNNILFLVELLIAYKAMGCLQQEDIDTIMTHIGNTMDENGGYALKNSHDNVTSLICAYKLLLPNMEYDINLNALSKGKHPRDVILWHFLIKPNWLSKLLLPIALLDIIRAILSSGKVRPKFWEKGNFLFRLKLFFGKLKRSRPMETVNNGEKHYYYDNGKEKVLYRIQNDGKILNLLRLSMLKKYKVLKPFVYLCHNLYIKKMGDDYQSQLFKNYFGEFNHPVREAYRQMDIYKQFLLVD